VHDPFYPKYQNDLWKTVSGANAAIIMVAHDGYKKLDLARLKALLKTPILVDGRQMVETAAAEDAGLIFRGLGRGTGAASHSWKARISAITSQYPPEE